MPKPAVFRDEALQKEFDENGFVKFMMFSTGQVEQLRSYYLETQTEHEAVVDRKKFHATNDTDDPILIADADRFIKQIMFEEVDKYFTNYKPIAANYLIKQPSEESELAPHQDLLFVDEERFYSFNIWVATEATNKTNGCLRFLKGSHNMHQTIRTLPSYPWKYQSVLSLIPQYLTDVPTEIGECVVLNHACIHSSYPNLSGKTRIAAILAMIPAGAEIVHYFLPEGDPTNKVEKYSMTLHDFINLKGGQRPSEAVLTSTFDYDFSPISDKAFREWVTRSNLSKNQHASKSTSFADLKSKLRSILG